MSIRIIRTGNDPVLRQVAKPVPQVNRAIEKLLDDLAETMYNAPGIGLAANQVGILKRVLVMDVGDGLIELINPEVLERSGSQTDSEACLSLPGLSGDVTRAQEVTIKAMNRQSEEFTFTARDLLARCAQHEIDHLNGILFIDYLTPDQIIHENEGARRK